MGADLWLGIDLGTSVCKALICDSSGHVLGSAERELEVRYPRPCWAVAREDLKVVITMALS